MLYNKITFNKIKIDHHSGPTIHHFDLYRLSGAGGGRVSAGSRSREKKGSPDSAKPSFLSALDAERCGLAEALGLVPSTGGDGDGGGVSLVEWADRLGSSSSEASSSSPSSSADAADVPLLLPDGRVLEVSIEPLPAERACELSARHPRLLLSSEEEGEEEDEDEEEEEFEEDEFDEFADTRWRLITLRPRGPRAREAAEEAARALRELNARGGRVAIEEEGGQR